MLNFSDRRPRLTNCDYFHLYICVFQGREEEPRSDPGYCCENTGEEELKFQP